MLREIKVGEEIWLHRLSDPGTLSFAFIPLDSNSESQRLYL